MLVESKELDQWVFRRGIYSWRVSSTFLNIMLAPTVVIGFLLGASTPGLNPLQSIVLSVMIPFAVIYSVVFDFAKRTIIKFAAMWIPWVIGSALGWGFLYYVVQNAPDGGGLAAAGLMVLLGKVTGTMFLFNLMYSSFLLLPLNIQKRISRTLAILLVVLFAAQCAGFFRFQLLE